MLNFKIKKKKKKSQCHKSTTGIWIWVMKSILAEVARETGRNSNVCFSPTIWFWPSYSICIILSFIFFPYLLLICKLQLLMNMVPILNRTTKFKSYQIKIAEHSDFGVNCKKWTIVVNGPVSVWDPLTRLTQDMHRVKVHFWLSM